MTNCAGPVVSPSGALEAELPSSSRRMRDKLGGRGNLALTRRHRLPGRRNRHTSHNRQSDPYHATKTNWGFLASSRVPPICRMLDCAAERKLSDGGERTDSGRERLSAG